MYEKFLTFTGLVNLSETNRIVLLVALFVGAAIIGLVTDAMMRSTGFGAMGNALVIIVGFAGSAILFNRYAHLYKLATPTNFIAAIAIGPLVFLILLAFLKRGLAKV